MLQQTKITYHPQECPDCGSRLFLTTTKKGIGYICENVYQYGCQGNAGAHEDGRPMGIPGNKTIRILRKFWHNLTDPFWMQFPGKKALTVRDEIYKFMQEIFEKKKVLEPGERFHIAKLTEEQLREAIQIAKTTLRRRYR